MNVIGQKGRRAIITKAMNTQKDFVAVYKKAYGLWQQKKLTEAERTLQEFWHNDRDKTLRSMLLMAYILRDQKKYVSEIKCLQELLQIFDETDNKDLLADGWSVLGSALRMLGESELSVTAFEKSVELEPDNWQKLVECSNAIFTANAIDGVTSEFMEQLYRKYRAILTKLDIVPYTQTQWCHNCMRIGYISADLRDHAVGQFVKPLFCQYDSSRFAVYAYALNEMDDGVTAVLKSGGAIWRNMNGKSCQEIAAQIHNDEIDILVDLAGHTANNVLPVMAWKPATVQLSGIGYFNSTGLQEIQGFLSDVYCSESEVSPYFTEKLLRLPRSHFCYQPFTQFLDVEQPPCLTNGYVTFGCFNNFAKVNDRLLLMWKDILTAVPHSRLLLKHSLLGTEEGISYTLARLKKLGVPLERIELRGLSKDYLRQYNDMDIALDTSPYPGGLTTCEALYMGVPVVTLKGNRHGARFGYSFLSNLGLQELVADSEREYVDIAIKIAGDAELLVLLREKLRLMMQSSPLMDSKMYMNELEELYNNLMEIPRMKE